MANKFAKYFSKALVNEAIDDEAQAGLDSLLDERIKAFSFDVDIRNDGDGRIPGK